MVLMTTLTPADTKGLPEPPEEPLSLWFKTSTANKPILQFGAAGTGTLFKVSINGSQSAVVDLGGVTISGGSSLADGNWHHLAVSVPENANSGEVKLYVDGSATIRKWNNFHQYEQCE